jgi:hypothetical protein
MGVWQEVPLEPTPGTAKNGQSLVSGGHFYGRFRARQALKHLAVQPCIETISGSNPPWFRGVYLFQKGSPWITLFIEAQVGKKPSPKKHIGHCHVRGVQKQKTNLEVFPAVFKPNPHFNLSSIQAFLQLLLRRLLVNQQPLIKGLSTNSSFW